MHITHRNRQMRPFVVFQGFCCYSWSDWHGVVMDIRKMLHTVCFMRPTRSNTLLKGTSNAIFPVSPHHPSFVISIITWVALHWKTCNITSFFTFFNKWSALDDRELSVLSGQEKIIFFYYIFPARSHRVHFSVSMPHLSLSNIWLLVKTFLCLSWVDSKNYITGLLTVSVCVRMFYLILYWKSCTHRGPCSYLKMEI